MCNFYAEKQIVLDSLPFFSTKIKRRKKISKKEKPNFFCWHAAWVCPCTAGHQGQGMQMRLCGRLSCKTCASWPLVIHPIRFYQNLSLLS